MRPVRAFFKTGDGKKLRDVETRVALLIREEQTYCVPINRPNLCNLFCALALYQSDLSEGIDDYLYGELPGIDFRRTGTCCRGDACCDFRFVRRRKNELRKTICKVQPGCK